jgi:hypothetical protein
MGSAFGLFGWNLADWFSIVGLPLALVGLWLSYQQVVSAKSEATAAKDMATATRDAIKRTEQHLADNHILLVVPELRQIGQDLDSAVDKADRDGTIRALRAWLALSGDLEGLLERADPGTFQPLIEQLRDSVIAAGAAKDDLIARAGELEPSTREARRMVTNVGAHAGKIVGGMRAFRRSRDGGPD